MQLLADIKWTDRSSSKRMRKHLSDFVCSKKSNVHRIFKDSTPPSSDQIEVSVRCGKVAKRSSFILLRGSRNKSKIIGACSTNHLLDLIDDFDFLREHMNKSNLMFTLGDPKITLEDDKFFEKVNKGFLQMKVFLADFLGIIAFIVGASGYLIFGENTQFAIISLILGLFFCVGSVLIGFWRQPKYILIEEE